MFCSKNDKVRVYAFADEANGMIDRQIEAMKRNALNGLEIRNVDGTNVSDITLEKAKEVKNKLDAAGLVTWSIGSPIGKIGINDAFAPHLDKLKHTLEVADCLGAKNIRLFSFYLPREAKVEDYKEEVIDRMGQFLEAAKGSGIDLCHENEKGIYGDIPERCLTLHKALPGLKGIFDFANYVQCDVDTVPGWELLKDYIKYLHIKDAVFGGKVVPAGKGDGNVSQLVQAFIAQGGLDMTIEPHLTVFDGLRNLERAGEESAVEEYAYASADEAFDAACSALREVL